MIKLSTIGWMFVVAVFGFMLGSIWQYNLDKTAQAQGNFPWKDAPGHPWHHGVPEK